MPASNQTGRRDATASGMIHCDVGAAKHVGNARAARRRRCNAGEGADLNDPLLEEQRAGNDAKHRFRDTFGALDLVGSKRERDREFIAAEAGEHRVRPKLVGKRDRNRLEQPVPGLIAMLVVDGLEAMDLERDDDQIARLALGGFGAQARRRFRRSLCD